jgi:hypothetical protein
VNCWKYLKRAIEGNSFSTLMKKIIFILILAAGVGGWIFTKGGVVFRGMKSEDMRKRIVKERDIAIAKAVKEGIYKCCINPPCTMCFMEANQWNNFKAGTCDCDNLIAQGKEPCPQCRNGVCKHDAEGRCKVNSLKNE